MSKVLILLCLFFAGQILLFSENLEKQSKKAFYFAPPSLIKRFSFGFSELYADILWMRLLQDIDFCSSKKGQPVYDGKTKYQCKKGWSYKMTEAITELAPRFLSPYEIAGSIMSVVMGDKEGAGKIYDKALKNFPHYWPIHFSASYHYLLELKQEKKAVPLLIKTADLGGPPWLYALAGKIYSQKGQLFLAREVLKSALEKNIKGEYKKSLELKLEKIEEQIKNYRKNKL